jgi:hypothetical protein
MLGSTTGKFMERDVRQPSRVFFLGIALCGIFPPAHAEPLRLNGVAGYISEWELSGELSEQVSGGIRQLSGPVRWKHVGLCSVNSPEEKSGQIKIEVSKSGAAFYMRAKVSMDKISCTYEGKLSDSSAGFMDCTDGKGIPLSLSLK